jgi:hypothetical protein
MITRGGLSQRDRRQYKTGNVRVTLTWGAFVQPLLQWKNSNYYILWVGVYSLKCLAWNARAPCYLWPVQGTIFFPHYLINSTIFKKKKVTGRKMRVLILTFFSETFFILRRIERDIKNVYWSSWKNTSYSCLILVKLEFSRQIFEKYSCIKFHENPSSGSRVVPCDQTDGQTWRS